MKSRLNSYGYSMRHSHKQSKLNTHTHANQGKKKKNQREGGREGGLVVRLELRELEQPRVRVSGLAAFLT